MAPLKAASRREALLKEERRTSAPEKSASSQSAKSKAASWATACWKVASVRLAATRLVLDIVTSFRLENMRSDRSSLAWAR